MRAAFALLYLIWASAAFAQPVTPQTITPVWFPHGLSGGAPVVSAGSFNPSTPATNGQTVGSVVATNSPTSFAITAGDPSGDFAISNVGTITFTAQGATDFAGGSPKQTASLTVTATNGAGTSGGVAQSISAWNDGSQTAVAGAAALYPHALDLQKVVALNITPGSGYTDGTYSLTGSGGGGSGFAGTVTVTGGQLQIAGTISNEGSGYTSEPTIAVPAGAGGGTGGSITATVYQARPPWKVADVDYGDGPNQATTLSDPTTSFPGCASYHSGTLQYVSFSGTCTLTSFNFCLHGGVGIQVSGISGTIDLETNKFCVTSAATDTGDLINIDHTNTGNFIIHGNDFNGTGVRGSAVVADSPAPVEFAGTGKLTFTNNRSYNIPQHVLDLSLGASVTNSAGLDIRGNSALNMGTDPAAHAGFAYTCGGTFSSVLQRFNFIEQQYGVPNLSGTAGMPMAADNGCGSPGNVTASSVDYNAILVQGNQSATGSNNSNAQGSSAGTFVVNNGGTLSTITEIGNYFDYQGARYPFYPSDGASTVSGNINAVTGNACAVGAGNCN